MKMSPSELIEWTGTKLDSNLFKINDADVPQYVKAALLVDVGAMGGIHALLTGLSDGYFTSEFVAAVVAQMELYQNTIDRLILRENTLRNTLAH